MSGPTTGTVTVTAGPPGPAADDGESDYRYVETFGPTEYGGSAGPREGLAQYIPGPGFSIPESKARIRAVLVERIELSRGTDHASIAALTAALLAVGGSP